MLDFLKRLSSRKFLLAFGFGFLVALNRYLELGFTQEELEQILKAILGYILAEGGADIVTRLKNS